MKQRIKIIQNVYGELERQREERKKLIADTRSINVSSTNSVSTFSVSIWEDILSCHAELEGCEIISCDITETHRHLKVINKTMKAEIVPGDVVQAGFVISNMC